MDVTGAPQPEPVQIPEVSSAGEILFQLQPADGCSRFAHHDEIHKRSALGKQAPGKKNRKLDILERQTKEFESSPGTSCPQQPNKQAVVSLSQPQLEEDIQRIRELMRQTNQDLQSVTRALLRASGDFPVARSLLLTPSSVPEPLWTRPDDDLLRSGDPVVRKRLQDKYGKEAVAKRLLFLEIE